MDKEQLNIELKSFMESCARDGRPIDSICLEEAFPGDNSTSYNLQVRARWIDGAFCYEAIEYLIDKLWVWENIEFRKAIFAIQVIDYNDKIQCVKATDQISDKPQDVFNQV